MLLCERSDLWNEIVSNVEDQPTKMIGTKLPLKCKRHGAVTEVQWPVDFTEVEEGGCTQPCGENLDCGHKVINHFNFTLSNINYYFINSVLSNAIPLITVIFVVTFSVVKH